MSLYEKKNLLQNQVVYFNKTSSKSSLDEENYIFPNKGLDSRQMGDKHEKCKKLGEIIENFPSWEPLSSRAQI